MAQRSVDNSTIVIIVDEGCVTCPFAGAETVCTCDEGVRPTHDYSYPVSCPLLKRTVEVRRV